MTGHGRLPNRVGTRRIRRSCQRAQQVSYSPFWAGLHDLETFDVSDQLEQQCAARDVVMFYGNGWTLETAKGGAVRSAPRI